MKGGHETRLSGDLLDDQTRNKIKRKFQITFIFFSLSCLSSSLVIYANLFKRKMNSTTHPNKRKCGPGRRRRGPIRAPDAGHSSSTSSGLQRKKRKCGPGIQRPRAFKGTESPVAFCFY